MEDKLFISNREKEALINYLSGNFNESDSSTLKNWLEKSQEHKFFLDQLSDIWQASRLPVIDDKIDVQSVWDELEIQLHYKNKNPFQWKRWIQIAAVVIVSMLAGGTGFYFLNLKTSSSDVASQIVEYVAPLGSRSYVKLHDGSKVWLNSGTSIKYANNFGTHNRDIQLSGEAFFEVAKNKNLPFIVNTGEISVTALGTKFNVKAYKEEKTIETTLLEGSVKLESSVVKLQENLVLKTNEKAVFTKKEQFLNIVENTTGEKEGEKTATNKPSMQIIQKIDPVPIVSWKEKRWIISNEKLGSLSVKLERRYDVNVIFDNEILKEYSFGGTLEDETLEQILTAISFAAPIKYVVDSKTVYIMADGKKMEKFKNLLME
ncbi:FecR family protein [Maribellus maritimus]|uniref:FecR family protein n=1 Tax=Maribellus maritimus TaxID=2870838 RepID=UPI001EEAD7CB|nr:FecR family protein [Maribellus maritimus]MCG6189185.1 FecR family protein [Maribellus maritimus]